MKRLLVNCLVLIVLLSGSTYTGKAMSLPAGGEQTQLLQTNSGTTVFLPVISTSPQTGWPTLAGDPQRTSRTAEEVTGQLRAEWYRAIEAYIPQNAHLIASDGKIFVPTSRGLYALNATNGDVAWRFDTQLPIGNSPTVANGVVYVPGFDRKIHALRASDGAYLWGFSGAGAGYSTNPLVVGGRVFAGNRDGWMYAIGAHGTPQQGQLLWKFQTGGMIDLSAAYKDGVLYFASNDNFAYALRVENGSQVWKSAKLPGDGYQSYWPVIYQDMVIFAAASGYRSGMNPGTTSITNSDGVAYGQIYPLERDEIFAGLPQGASVLFGSIVSGQTWANGKQVLHAGRIIDYLEDNPHRMVLVALHLSNGSPYTFDADRDGRADYLPAVKWGTHSGNRYPPVVGSDGLLYFSTILSNQPIPQGRVMGWSPGLPYLSQVGGQGAIDEPQAISIGGNTIYRTICCDRLGDWFSTNSNRNGFFWNYVFPLSTLLPNYDRMWYGTVPGDSVRLHGNYGTLNGIYNAHGDQNPLIPYQGKVYVHRSNAVIAFGPGPVRGELPLLRINHVQDSPVPLDAPELRARLEIEVQKIVSAGHLRPGYYNSGQAVLGHLANYFDNPGDTLYTLSIAHPYLSPGLQTSVRNYLQTFFQTYFVNRQVTRIGWATGAAREAMPLPPETQASLANLGDRVRSDSNWSWEYPPHNFYALWKYAQLVPADQQAAYNLAKNRIQVPVPADDQYLRLRPFEHNAYLAGYFGFLRLFELVGSPSADQGLRTNVQNEYNRLLALRISQFSKDTPHVEGNPPESNPDFRYHHRAINISRNFMFLTPELGDYLHTHARDLMEEAIHEYNFTAPFWFATRYTATVNEGVRHNLYDVPAMFQAKAYILKENRGQLTKYLDVPAFERGDLFYIQNLVAALQAP